MLVSLLPLLALAQDPAPAPADAAPADAAPADAVPADAVPADAGEPVEVAEPMNPGVTFDALEALRSEILEAVKAKNVDALLKTLDPDVVVTTTGGEALHGREAVREYIEKMIEGPFAPIRGFSCELNSKDLPVLHGDGMATAWGPSHDHYDLVSGETLDLDTRWSATLVWGEGRWLVAEAHSSVDAYHNPLDKGGGGLLMGVGALLGGLVMGSLGGLIVGRLFPRKVVILEAQVSEEGEEFVEGEGEGEGEGEYEEDGENNPGEGR